MSTILLRIEVKVWSCRTQASERVSKPERVPVYTARHVTEREHAERAPDTHLEFGHRDLAHPRQAASFRHPGLLAVRGAPRRVHLGAELAERLVRIAIEGRGEQPEGRWLGHRRRRSAEVKSTEERRGRERCLPSMCRRAENVAGHCSRRHRERNIELGVVFDDPGASLGSKQMHGYRFDYSPPHSPGWSDGHLDLDLDRKLYALRERLLSRPVQLGGELQRHHLGKEAHCLPRPSAHHTRRSMRTHHRLAAHQVELVVPAVSPDAADLALFGETPDGVELVADLATEDLAELGPDVLVEAGAPTDDVGVDGRAVLEKQALRGVRGNADAGLHLDLCIVPQIRSECQREHVARTVPSMMREQAPTSALRSPRKFKREKRGITRVCVIRQLPVCARSSESDAQCEPPLQKMFCCTEPSFVTPQRFPGQRSARPSHLDNQVAGLLQPGPELASSPRFTLGQEGGVELGL